LVFDKQQEITGRGSKGNEDSSTMVGTVTKCIRGKLELSKCFYYIVYWVYDKEGIPSMGDPKDIQSQIDIIDGETNLTVNIESKSSYESHKTLGVMECPSGIYKDEFNRLLKKSKGFAQRLATTMISRQATRVLYQSMYLPSMAYSLAIGTFNIEQCNKIQGGTVQQFLALMGYNRNMPCSITYGPKEFGGIGLQHLFAIKGSEKVYNILSNRTPLEGQPMTSHMIPVDVQHKEKYRIAYMTEKVGNKITHQCVKNWEQHQCVKNLGTTCKPITCMGKRINKKCISHHKNAGVQGTFIE
jgi:hypothetical protein